MTHAPRPDAADSATLLAHAERWREHFTPIPAGARVAVVICMDNRIDPTGLLGLNHGDAYVIRNAGGILTDDVRRSLAVAQHALGVEEIILIHHTDCGMAGLDDRDFADDLTATTGVRPTWRPGGFSSAAQDVREMLTALAADPHIPGGARARGFIYSVEDGSLSEV